MWAMKAAGTGRPASHRKHRVGVLQRRGAGVDVARNADPGLGAFGADELDQAALVAHDFAAGLAVVLLPDEGEPPGANGAERSFATPAELDQNQKQM